MSVENVVIETIIKRRSIRKYLDKPVPFELLQQIIDAGLYAPSGGNHQYVRLFVIEDKARLERLNNELCKIFLNRELDSSNYQNKSAVRARQPNCQFLFQAPVLISAVAPRNHPNSMADSANALENIQIAAAAFDLGACWVNQPHWTTDEPEVRKIFEEMGMTETEDIFGSVVVGYRDGEKAAPLPRKDGRTIFDMR